MKKITEEEFKKVKFKRRKGLSNKLSTALKELEVGGHLFIERKEWTLNSEPSSIISNASSYIKGELVGYKFSIKQLENDSGWIITRKENLDEAPEVDTGYRCSICKEMFETRRSTRRHLTETHPGKSGRVMYIVAGRRTPSKKWQNYIKNKEKGSILKKFF